MNRRSPFTSLEQAHWFKLICGASFQHLPSVRNLTLAYTLAGADCIDVAADPAAIAAARSGMAAAREANGGDVPVPWLMASLNDGEDPHFRKARFDATQCPSDCPQPCEQVCPANAILFNREDGFSGVVDELCYGCGRCLPVCPEQIIHTHSYVRSPESVAPLILESGIDALEIHTQVGRQEEFARLWQAIAPHLNQLQLVAVSCPDGEELTDYLWHLYHLMSPLPCLLVWQTDGRPMSGDIGAGTTRATIRLAEKVLAANLPGFVQLAGGTNERTVPKLQELGLLNNGKAGVSGVAYGSYARVLLWDLLEQLDTMSTSNTFSPSSLPLEAGNNHLEKNPALLNSALERARGLVSQLKDPLFAGKGQ
ncbi:LdpA C-terminal domain-containing domain [Geitlerinema sp. PCC 9228]|uniref:circadian clock protein LdpA n=1 Tax=Geitlerinema sp. PCC 9228 TaxID=111611 RepID=UPI0008F9B36A|nr:LdpA C-terminal domain-containing domain [Geitlerinema sp. PCC 9228]